jgi:hypothetical protein
LQGQINNKIQSASYLFALRSYYQACQANFPYRQGNKIILLSIYIAGVKLFKNTGCTNIIASNQGWFFHELLRYRLACFIDL